MPVPAVRRTSPLCGNTITFPRTLRDAIPDQELSAGRVLMLDSIDASASHTKLRGHRVHLRLGAKEAGKLTGAFGIFADLDLDAAEGLAALLRSAIDQARNS
jgi:hypothetical protein